MMPEIIIQKIYLPAMANEKTLRIGAPLPGYVLQQIVYLGEIEDGGVTKKECLFVFAGMPTIIKAPSS